MAAELENSPPPISAGTSPEAAQALREWHKRYTKQVASPIKRAPKPMFSSVADLLAWVKDGGEIVSKVKGKPAKKNAEEVPTKITWTKPTPEGGVFTFVEFRFAADIEREKEAAEAAKKAKPRVTHVPKKGKQDAFKWACLAISDDTTRSGLLFAAIAPNGDVFASDGHRAHRALGVFPPSEGWRGVDKNGVEIEIPKDEEHLTLDQYVLANSALPSLAKNGSLFASDVAGTDDPRVECVLSEKFLGQVASMFKVAKREIKHVNVHLDGGVARADSAGDFEWTGPEVPALKVFSKTGSVDVRYLLEACADFATVKWPVAKAVEYYSLRQKQTEIVYGPAHIKSVHGEALVMPVRR
jgi:hypothetical protein